jgi:hypothetical protein
VVKHAFIDLSLAKRACGAHRWWLVKTDGSPAVYKDGSWRFIDLDRVIWPWE